MLDFKILMQNNILKNNALLIIDAQEKIINPIKNKFTIIKNIRSLLDAYEILGDYVYISEQNPKKLGKTIPDLLPKINFKLFEKVKFSLGYNANFKNDLDYKKITNLIVCGFETHICIQQSVLDFLHSKFKVYVVADAMASRNNFDHEIGLKRMISEGAIIATTESIIFELCETSSRKEFKSISNIIKNK